MSEFREQPLLFECQGETLCGILHRARSAHHRLGVVIVVGGPQYRVGSHRQFLHLARALAVAGIPVLRFDLRGMGDSTGEPITFEEAGPDIEAAIQGLICAEPGIDGVVLWGLCDAASAILIFGAADAHVRGLVLLNPWVRSDATLASARISNYYRNRLFSRVFWQKLMRGNVDLTASLGGFFSDWRKKFAAGRGSSSSSAGSLSTGAATVDFREAMLDGLRKFDMPVLLILSGEDLTAGEFVKLTSSDARWSETIARSNVTVRELAGADHTFSSARWRAAVEQWTLAWLGEVETGSGDSSTGPHPRVSER